MALGATAGRSEGSNLSPARKPCPSNVKLDLVFPPAWLPFAPYPSLPALAGALRPQGVELRQFDLNCETFDDLLSPERLLEAADLLARMIHLGSSRSSPVRTRELRRQRLIAQRLAPEIEAAKSVFREAAAFYDEVRLDGAMRAVEEAFAFYRAVPVSATITLLPFELEFAPSGDLLSLLDEPTLLNPFYLARIGEIVAAQPDVVGFSVHSFSQLYFALLGGRRIKELAPEIHLTIGGTFLTRFQNRRRDFPSVLPGFDTAVLFDGAEPLLHLCERVQGGRRVDPHPNLVVLDRGRAPSAPVRPNPRCSPLVEPDLDGLPLERYLAPHLIVSLPVSVGCSWRRCAFCSYNLQPYREADPDRVVETIARLASRYGTRWFYFSVSELEPDHLRALCREISRRGLSICWTSLTRASSALTPELCRQMFDAGCRLMAVGVESGSSAVLAAMNKGTDSATAEAALRNLNDAGIATVAYFIEGFPHESLEDIESTLDFIATSQRSLFGYVLSRFILTPDAPIGRNPRRWGIEITGGHQEDLFTAMQPTHRLTWRPRPSVELEERKRARLQQFKIRSRNFFAHPDQYNPLRAPPDLFYNFLYLSENAIAPGPGRFADGRAFLAAIPRVEATVLEIEEFRGDRFARWSLAAEGRSAGRFREVMLCHKPTGRRTPLTPATRLLLTLVDGRRSVQDLVRALPPTLRTEPRFEDALLSALGGLYAGRFIELSEAVDA